MKDQFKKNLMGCLFASALLLLTVHVTAQSSKQVNEKAVRAVYTAYEKKDWSMLKALFADGFTFNSPNDDHIDLKTYKVRCWPNSANIKKFDIDKLVVGGDDVFVLYRGWTMNGREMQNTEYFKLKAGKIKEYTCFFGPGISYPDNKKK